MLGSVGRLSKEKRYDRLIRALAEMRRHAPEQDVVLVLVGDGPERPSLEGLANELKLASRVIFCGYQENARSYLNVFDLFLLSSETEGMPVALLEAMAAGCPVGVTNVGDCLDVIDGGKAGILLPEDEAMWPGLLTELMTGGRDGLLRFGAAGLQRFETHYLESATLDAYEALYGGGL